MTPDELKAQLLAKAEAAIHEIVEQYQNQQPKTLDEIEHAAIKAGQDFKVAVLKGMVEANPSSAGVVRCEQCGKKMQHKGTRQKWVQTQAGEVQIEREYYYCETCHTGFFPH
jgi:hypothetical protein